MFLKYKPIKAIDDCVIHRDSIHVFEFIRYCPMRTTLVVRIRCEVCHKAGINDWEYCEVTPHYWLGFILEHGGNDFTSAN